MGILDKKELIKSIYDDFEKDTAKFKETAACKSGCAYCCSGAGNIDITTLEGLIITDEIIRMPKSRKSLLEKSVPKNMKKWKDGKPSPCPFLMKNKSCMIYHVRPFSCRRIYSTHTCNRENPPALHREVMERSLKTIRDLQKLDDTGYSGHISCILHMLSAPQFLNTYLQGEHKPEEVVSFGKTFKIIINRMVV